MASEGSGLNPVAILVHLLGIALGAYAGLLVMAEISPDLPGEDVGPGVSSSSAPAAVGGDDPDSLFRAANLGPALSQLGEQLPAGEGIVALHLEPGALDARTRSGEDLLAAGDVPPEVPALLATEINAERGDLGLAEIRSMDLVVTARGPRWYVQLDTSRDIGPPPWTYGAPLDGAPLETGVGIPKPVR